VPLGMEVGFGPGDFVLDGDTQLPLLEKGAEPPIVGPFLVWPNSWMHKMPLGMEIGLGPGHILLDGDLAPPKGRHSPAPQFSAHVYCGQTDVCIRIPLVQ